MSVNKKNRSLWNTRYEAQKIYYQRREINKLNNKNKDLQQRIDKAIFFISTTFDNYLVDEYIKNNLLKTLRGDSNE